MSGQIHQLFAGEADLDAAWARYSDLAKQMEADPGLKLDRVHVDRTLAAFAEYKRLFDLSLERGRQ